MILFTHPTGNANVRQALIAFEEAGLLGCFSTALAVPSGCPFLSRRSYPVSWGKTCINPWREALRLASTRNGLKGLTRPESGWASIDRVYQTLDKKNSRMLKSPKYNAIYAYEDGALESFRAAKRMNKAAIYELPIAYGPYARRLLEQEAKIRPEWAITLGGLHDSGDKLIRKKKELEAADKVIVPSQFVLDSLPDTIRQSRPCHVVPYGADTDSDRWMAISEEKVSDGPLKVLFVGSLSQRKGLANVLEAATQLHGKSMELHLLGSPLAPMIFYRKVYPHFTYHPPCPNAQVKSLMQACDVLVLPSLVEGRALVQLEALSCGLPLLVTPNAGGSDLVIEGQTGFMLQPSSTESLVERLAWLMNNRERLPAMRRACLAMAKKMAWVHYRKELVDVVRGL